MLVAPVLRYDPVGKVQCMLSLALFLLGDKSIDPEESKKITGISRVCILMDLQNIFVEHQFLREDGNICPFEHIWETDEKFGIAVHESIYRARRNHFPDKNRKELLVFVKRVTKVLMQVSPEIPKTDEISHFIKFLKEMQETVNQYKKIN